jgi:hypothetical protein
LLLTITMTLNEMMLCLCCYPSSDDNNSDSWSTTPS